VIRGKKGVLFKRMGARGLAENVMVKSRGLHRNTEGTLKRRVKQGPARFHQQRKHGAEVKNLNSAILENGWGRAAYIEVATEKDALER